MSDFTEIPVKLHHIKISHYGNSKKNTLGTVVLNDPAQNYLLKLASFFEAKAYSPMTVRNYMAGMRHIFAYYNHLNPEQLTQEVERLRKSPVWLACPSCGISRPVYPQNRHHQTQDT